MTAESDQSEVPTPAAAHQTDAERPSTHGCSCESASHERSARTPMSGRPVVIAIFPAIPRAVLDMGIEQAKALGSDVVFVHVDPDRVPSPADPLTSNPLDPHSQMTPPEVARTALDIALEVYMDDHREVSWELLYLAGLPARELAHLAHRIGAGCFVLGTRRPGLRSGLQEWLDGSVAGELGRRQLRPVVVVPLRAEDWENPLCGGPAPKKEDEESEDAQPVADK